MSVEWRIVPQGDTSRHVAGSQMCDRSYMESSDRTGSDAARAVSGLPYVETLIVNGTAYDAITYFSSSWPSEPHR